MTKHTATVTRKNDVYSHFDKVSFSIEQSGDGGSLEIKLLIADFEDFASPDSIKEIKISENGLQIHHLTFDEF